MTKFAAKKLQPWLKLMSKNASKYYDSGADMVINSQGWVSSQGRVYSQGTLTHRSRTTSAPKLSDFQTFPGIKGTSESELKLNTTFVL